MNQQLEECYLDAETTGLESEIDELLEVSIVDGAGAVSFASLLRPTKHTEWPGAQGKNNISPEMVAQSPTLDQVADQIRAAVEGKRVVIYNASFDAAFLGELLDGAAEISCCMVRYASEYGEWSDYWGDYQWVTLQEAARDVRHEWTGEAHRATADALACRSVWRYLTIPEVKLTVDAEREGEYFFARRDMTARHRDERWARYMSEFLDTWWLKRYGIEHWTKKARYGYPPVEEQLCVLFFGMDSTALNWAERYETIYRRKTEIPAGVRPISWFPRWAREHVDYYPAAAAYISLSGKQRWLLYSEELMDSIRVDYPYRELPVDVPEGYRLATKTQLRKAGVKDSEITKLTPATERVTSYGDWYFLYLVTESQFSHVDL